MVPVTVIPAVATITTLAPAVAVVAVTFAAVAVPIAIFISTSATIAVTVPPAVMVAGTTVIGDSEFGLAGLVGLGARWSGSAAAAETATEAPRSPSLYRSATLDIDKNSAPLNLLAISQLVSS